MIPRIAIATPTHGHWNSASVSMGYCMALYGLAKSVDVLPPHLLGHGDLVRARSRSVRLFLAHEKDFTHLLFWDSDVGGRQIPNVLNAMLAQDCDVIGADYSRKLYRPGFKVASVHNAEKGLLGMGFTLIKRRVLEQMTEHYRKCLTFMDYLDGEKIPTVALFMLRFHEGVLLGEDFSFCQRWIDMGGEVRMYHGEGTPLEHVGSHCYVDGKIPA